MDNLKNESEAATGCEASAVERIVMPKTYPRFKMVEIYSGKDPQWKGWHNLLIEWGEGVECMNPIQGPIDPKTSKMILEIPGVFIEA